MARERTTEVAERASARIEKTIDGFLIDISAAEHAAVGISRSLPPDIVARLDFVISYKHASYRDAILIQFAFVLEADVRIDATFRQEGGRGCAGRLGAFLGKRHIRGVVDAYQNVAKNTDQMARGNVDHFDKLLIWANNAELSYIESAFIYTAAKVALSARPVSPMPILDRGKLDFAAMIGLVNELLDTPSEGAHEQFLVAACVDELIDEFGAGGIGGLRAETKPLNASDKSSRALGDVQIRQRNIVEEAFEITANDWTLKVEQADQTAHAGGLRRVHILAKVPSGAVSDVALLAEKSSDISALDVRAFLHVITAFLTKPGRASALVKFYKNLEIYQPNISRVNAYVAMLVRRGLAD